MPLVNVHVAVKDKVKDAHKFMPFEWDKEDTGKQDTGEIEMTEEDWDALDKNFPANKLDK